MNVRGDFISSQETAACPSGLATREIMAGPGGLSHHESLQLLGLEMRQG